MKTGYSKIIEQNYIINSKNVLTFEDDTVYTPKEMKAIKGQSPEMLRGVHRLKKYFNGEVVK